MFTYYKTQLFSELKSMKIWLVSLLFFMTSYALAYYSYRFDFQYLNKKLMDILLG